MSHILNKTKITNQKPTAYQDANGRKRIKAIKTLMILASFYDCFEGFGGKTHSTIKAILWMLYTTWASQLKYSTKYFTSTAVKELQCPKWGTKEENTNSRTKTWSCGLLSSYFMVRDFKKSWTPHIHCHSSNAHADIRNHYIHEVTICWTES